MEKIIMVRVGVPFFFWHMNYEEYHYWTCQIYKSWTYTFDRGWLVINIASSIYEEYYCINLYSYNNLCNYVSVLCVKIEDMCPYPWTTMLGAWFNFLQLFKKQAYGTVRTRFDLNPKQEWIQAHVAQTMNL